MKTRSLLSAATALALVLGGGTALAASSNSSMSSTSTSAGMASDSLSLTGSQQKSAWNAISKQARIQTLPSSFSPAKGSVVPSDVTLQPVPVEAANQVPKLRPYDYAMAQNKILIVNPSDKKVVDIITKS
jgi:hypothetical protein